MNNIELKTSDPIYNLEVKRANVIVGSGSSVDVVWGSIVGDISQQTDLQDELNGIKEQVKEDIANKADRSELANLATKEELSSGLLGKADKENTYTKEEVDDKIAETDLSNYYTKQEIDEKGYITAETDPTVPEWAKQPTKPTYTAEEVGALSADTEIPDISGLATKEEVETKQDKLVSGTNIKTVNGNSLLGEGNIEIQGGISDAPTDGKKYVRQNQNWVEETDTSSFATKSEIPTNISQLNNDSGYLTEIPTEYITEEELISKDYATNTSLSTKLDVATYNEDKANFATKDEIPEALPIASSDTLGGIKVGAGLSINSETGVLSATGGGIADSVDWANVTSKPDFKTVATTGSYNDLTDKPTIPTKTSELTNDSGFITSIPEEYVTETELSGKNYATVSQIPSLEGYATQTWVSEQGYLTEHQDISNLATKEELTNGLANKANTSDIADMLTKTEASTTYATKAELGDINAILDNINGEVV